MSTSGSGVFFNNAKPIELSNEKHMSSGGHWVYTILEAKDTGKGSISLSYASPKSYNHPNRNTTESVYSLAHGFWTGQSGNRSAGSIGINWKNVKSVSGKTFDVKDMLKEKGYRWNRDSKRYEMT